MQSDVSVQLLSLLHRCAQGEPVTAEERQCAANLLLKSLFPIESNSKRFWAGRQEYLDTCQPWEGSGGPRPGVMGGGTPGCTGGTAAHPTSSSFPRTLPMFGQQLVHLNSLEEAPNEVWWSPKERQMLSRTVHSIFPGFAV